MRLYLLQLGLVPTDFGDVPLPGYLIQTDQDMNVLIDTGYPRSIRGRQEQAATQLLEAFPDDEVTAFNATVVIRGVRDDAEDLIVNRLAVLGLGPQDINYLVCTHFDMDHAGNHDLFPNAELVVQRRHYEVAHQHPRFRFFDIPWDTPDLRYRFVDGDTQLLPGIELIESSGHVPGHQSILVRLPEIGPVLLAADAIVARDRLEPEVPPILQDMDHAVARASTRKLIAITEREGVKLIVFGHDAEQWQTLKKSPEFYE
ncbi:MAG TPA: N-acyl homoserine lactonase family protein [Roseiflexaceae bacterium]|nr:N-acyl homoserine lactonase family protein [Roseiflexaceae bacterium]